MGNVPMSNVKLSVCYIVKNEAMNLPVSLNSVKAADELIVVDTGSQDTTREIARDFGAVVYEFTWRDDFSAPRNFAIDKAHGEWIIFLDADEAFARPLDRAVLLKYLDGLYDKEAVLLCRHNVDSWEEKKDFSEDWAPRIFRRRKYLRYRGRIHEHIAKEGGILRVAYAPKEFYLLHTGYAQNISREKSWRNLGILQKAIAAGEWEPVYDYYLTDCYYGLQEYEKALEYAERYMQSGTWVHGGNGHIYRMILECMRHLSMSDAEMLPWAEQACQDYPDLPEFYAEQGMILCGLGRLSEARKLLHESISRYETGSAEFCHETYFSPEVAAKVAARLGEIEARFGNKERAAQWFVQALEYCDTNEKVVAKAERFLAEYEKG